MSSLEAAQADQKSEQKSGVSSLLMANSLDYRMPPNLSVVVKRQLVRHFFDKNTYSAGQNMVAILNGGDMYIDPKNSYISYKVRTTGSALATFGSGSAVNCINRITLTSESGTEVERVEGVNNLARELDRWGCSNDWVNSQGGVMGYKSNAPTNATWTTTANITGAGAIVYEDDRANGDLAGGGGIAVPLHAQRNDPVIDSSNTRQYVIPLNRVAGLFTSDKLLPGMGLMSGMRVEITLEDKKVALKWVDATGAPADPGSETYEITDLSIVLDSYQLNDAILRELSQQSASNSLEVVFQSYDRTPAAINSAATTLNVDAKRAVSRANWALAKTRVGDHVNGGANYGFDSFKAENFDATGLPTKYQYNLAGLYFPNQPLTTEYEYYENALYAFGKASKCHKPSSVDLEQFDKGHALMCATLERSTALGLSGLPLSGSRILRLEAIYSAAQSAGGRVIDLHIGYIKMLRVFLDRVVVKE